MKLSRKWDADNFPPQAGAAQEDGASLQTVHFHFNAPYFVLWMHLHIKGHWVPTHHTLQGFMGVILFQWAELEHKDKARAVLSQAADAGLLSSVRLLEDESSTHPHQDNVQSRNHLK